MTIYTYQKGYSYPVVLVFVALTSISAGITQYYSSTLIKREKERELLFIGQQYIRAIHAYHRDSGGLYPNSIDELLQDRRFINKKHLRKLYRDPFFEGEGHGFDWVLNNNQKIIGVKSRSTLKPIRQKNISADYPEFDGAETYSHWVFIHKLEKEKTFPSQ